MGKKVCLVLILFLGCYGSLLYANSREIVITTSQLQEIIEDTVLSNNQKQVKFKRGKAILFTIFTGILGGHRIYLGTHQRTPIFYSVTLGGLGILPLFDLVHIIFSKDISKYEDKKQFIMWGQ